MYKRQTYNRYPVVFDHGKGVTLYDSEGNAYLDFGAGIAVMGLGYGDEAFNQAVKAQVDQLTHISNLFYNKPSADAGAVSYTHLGYLADPLLTGFQKIDAGNLRHGFQHGADVLCGAFDGQVHSPGSGHLPFQVFRGVAGDQLAAVDDEDVVADRADLGQDEMCIRDRIRQRCFDRPRRA